MHNGGCWQGNFTENFSALLQTLEKPRKEIAFGLGLNYSTFDNYVRGLVAFPPDLIPALYWITKDRRVPEFFTVPCGFFLRRKPFSAKETTDPVKEAYDLGPAMGKAQQVVRDAMLDGRLTPDEHNAIHRALDALEKEIMHVHEAIK